MDLDLAAQGTSAEEPCEVPGTRVTREDGTKGAAQALLRVLDIAELGDVRAFARQYARARGIETPVPDHEEYREGLAVGTVLRAVVSPDPASPKRRVPHFTSEADIRRLHPTVLAYLYQRQAIWQDRCSPLFDAISDTDILTLARKEVEHDDARFFCAMPPAMQSSFAHGMAVLLLALPAVKSLSGTPEDSSTPTSNGPNASTSVASPSGTSQENPDEPAR